jgi:hypothetical protein
MRGMWRRVTADDTGMTLVEVVVSAVIMFVILTGILGLVTQTTLIAAQAKQKTVLTNAVNSYVEYVVGLPFEQVVVGAGAGELAAEQVRTIGEYTVTLRPTVQNVSGNAALKNLFVNATITLPNGSTDTWSTRVAIRNRALLLSQGTDSTATDPTVEWVSPTPADETVVSGSTVLGGGSITLKAQADASTGRTIDSVIFWMDNARILKDTGGNTAQWTPSTQNWTNASSFVWNTLQTEPEVQPDNSVIDVRVVPDGQRAISVYAIDSAGVSRFDQVYLLVDNDPPAMPASLTPAVNSNTSVGLSWPQAMDGTQPAHRYELLLFKHELGFTGSGDPISYWSSITGYSGPNLSFSQTTTTFSRYAAFVRAVSPWPRYSGYRASGPTTYYSRPLVTGTYVVSGKNHTPTLTITPPNFPTSGTTTYEFWRALGTASPVMVSTGTTTTRTLAAVSMNNVNDAAATYYVVVRFTPSGYGGGTETQVISNRVTMGYQKNNGTYTFPAGTW